MKTCHEKLPGVVMHGVEVVGVSASVRVRPTIVGTPDAHDVIGWTAEARVV